MNITRATWISVAIGFSLGLVACGAWTNRDCYVFGNQCPEQAEKEFVWIVGEPGEPGANCQVRQVSEGAEITCGNEVVLVRNGQAGAAGPAGSDGMDGSDGRDGADGRDGTGCTVQSAVGGALVTCGENSVLVTNGLDGQDGRDGSDAPPTPYTVTEMINPCGDGAGADEVLLRLANGQLVAHYSHGSRQFLTVLEPGSYITTDGEGCRFTVDSEMNVRW